MPEQNHILLALLKAARSIQNSIHSYVQHSVSQNHQQTPSRVDFVSGPPAQENYYAAEYNDRPQKKRRENIQLVLSALGLFAACWAAFLAFRSMRETQRQANAAQDQVTIMQAQYEATVRPWIFVENASPTEPLSFDQKTQTYSLSVKYTLKNVGHTPALHVRLFPRLFVVSTTNLAGSTTCEHSAMPYYEGIDIFPDQTKEIVNAVTIAKRDIKYAHAAFGDFAILAVDGCADYAWLPNEKRRHHSPFYYGVLVSGGLITPKTISIPKGALILAPNPTKTGPVD